MKDLSKNYINGQWQNWNGAVSYTHLTLPTNYSV